MKKRVIAMLLIGAMVLATAAGCGSQNSGGTGNTDNQSTQGKAGSQGTQGNLGDASTGADSGTPASTESDKSLTAADTGIEPGDFSEHLTISLWMLADDYKGYYSDYSENPVVAWLEDKFNVTFEMQQPAVGSEQEQFNLMIGTGEYTEIFMNTYSQDSVDVLYDDGVIQDLAPYLETYAPNYYKYLHTNEVASKTAYNDEGQMFLVANTADRGQLMWGGLAYRRDILETMTGGNVAFPSGGEDPATIADWDYMLELMHEYFESAGITDYACLIIPSSGYFATGDLLDGFGTGGDYFIDGDTVKYGPVTDGFYNYLVKMKEWYDKGYVYKDFASRTQDPMYLPNTALTYGGAAGVWYALTSQLGDAMSMPEYNLEMLVNPIISPLDEENGAEYQHALMMIASNEVKGNITDGFACSSECSEEKIIRWLQICDYLYTEEGGMAKSYGLTKEQAKGNEIYEKLGLTDGAYWYDEEGNFTYNPLLDPFGEATYAADTLRAMRFPGLDLYEIYNGLANEDDITASDIWTSGGYENVFPLGASMTVDESNTYNGLVTSITDYINSMVPKLIIGTEPLTKESFDAYVKQVYALGLDTCLEIKQAEYDRYMAK